MPDALQDGRKEIVAFLRGLSPEGWARVGTHTEVGPITMEAQAVLISAHDGCHRQQTLQWLAA